MAGVCKLKSDIKPERGLTLKPNEQWAEGQKPFLLFSGDQWEGGLSHPRAVRLRSMDNYALDLCDRLM